MSKAASGAIEDRMPLTAAAGWIESARGQLHALDQPDLPALFGELLRLAATAHGLAVGVLIEAQSRGVIDASTSTGVPAWVTDRAAEAGVQITGADAAAFARVAAESARPDMAVYAGAVTTGRVSVTGGSVLGKELRRIREHVPAATWDACVAEGGVRRDQRATRQRPRRVAGHPDHTVRRRPRLPAQAGTAVPRCPGADPVASRAVRHQHRPHPARSGRRGPGRGHHRSARRSQPGTVHRPGHGQVPARVPRTAGQRRADALVDLCQAYATHPDVTAKARAGAAARAQVIVTMDWEHLRDQCGYGLTEYGRPLSPQSVRAFACDADVIPMVLGGTSEILDQGRAQRTATAGQWAHLRQRDGGCTLPGCDRPPGFCQAHHIRWWERDDGRTDINNLTLVCHRHHQVIHRDGYTADVTAYGVSWRLQHPPPRSRTS